MQIMTMVLLLIIALLFAVLAVMALSAKWRREELAGVRHDLAHAQKQASHYKESEAMEEMRADQLQHAREAARTAALETEKELACAIVEIERVEKEKHALEHTLAAAAAAHAIEVERLKLPPRPARITLKDAMSEELMLSILRGTEKLPLIRAVEALLMHAVVKLSDISTDVPRETIQLPDRTIAPYTAEMRLHDGGGAYHVADLLSRLQELTLAREEEPKEAAA